MIQTRILIYDKLYGTQFRARLSMDRRDIVLSLTLGTLFVPGLGTMYFFNAKVICFIHRSQQPLLSGESLGFTLCSVALGRYPLPRC
jgi:hypothetical protein